MLQTIIATLFALLTFVLPLVEANNKKTAAKLAGGVLAGIIVGIIVFFGKYSSATNVILPYQYQYPQSLLLLSFSSVSRKDAQGGTSNNHNINQMVGSKQYIPSIALY